MICTPKLITALLVSTSLTLSGCGTLTGIPSHGGGKRFSVEQKLVSSSVRAALKQIDVRALRGKVVAVQPVVISDTGAGDIVGGRLSLGATAATGLSLSPATTTLNQFQVFDLVNTSSSATNVQSSGAGTTTSVAVSTGTGTSETESSNNGTSNTETSTSQDPTTTTQTGTTTTGANQTTSTTTTQNPETTTTTTSSSTPTTTTGGSSSTTTTTSTPSTTQTGSTTSTQTSTGTTVTNQSSSTNQTTTTTPGTTTNTTNSTQNSTTTPGTTTNTTVTGATTGTQTTVVQNPETTTNTSNTTTTSPGDTETSSSNTSTQNGSSSTSTTNNNTTDTNGNSTETSESDSTTNKTDNIQDVVETPKVSVQRTKGATGSIEGRATYHGLGTHRIISAPKSDSSFLVEMVHTYLRLSGVRVTSIRDTANPADVILYVNVDVFGINRSRMDMVAFNKETVIAETALEVYTVDRRTGEIILFPQYANAEAEYNEKFVLWAGPFLQEKIVRDGEGYLVDFADVDGTKASYGTSMKKQDHGHMIH